MTDWLPPTEAQGLERNGYAMLSDLELPEHVAILRSMEAFQAEFVAQTRPIWRHGLAITGDTLYNFSRQWEYPYAWVNLGARTGRILDAGSGMTFFPYLLAASGFEVQCCDANRSLASEFDHARSLTGYRVGFAAGSIAEMPYPAASFDSAVCISVLEHVGAARTAAIGELARVLKPGGRLVVTCDLSLSRDCDTILEDLAVVIAEIRQRFQLLYPLNLSRPSGLLTSDYFRATEAWRLPWHPFSRTPLNILRFRAGKRHFRSVAVLGLTARRI
jgi:2-polyprenyl-3-methyl-5-hydroxy-6-metoxy-1,4-benzoquinol methylase